MSDGTPRIGPGTRREIGPVNFAISRLAGLVAGTNPPHLFTTLGRHRGLFRRWLLFAGSLMPGGRLPRADTELVILRVAALCDCAYERTHHERLGRRAGLSEAEISRVPAGPTAEGWSVRQELLLRATDELHEHRRISDATWSGLAQELDEVRLLELCLLVGHYEMLAMTLNSAGTQPDRRRRGR